MVQSEEFMQILLACKDKLSPTQALVFTMKYLDGEEAEDICKELNISASNYWVIVHHAKLQLRQCLEKNWMS
jgi:DNA-directed RNA polymerase specialized sigma24 family protein